ncbi:enhancer of mRNA-decapping protein 4-like isoform X2 [Phalaenopsis equestris]|uniref:enhancer of mRNA-decapping protein 4-like isoform X2 n=1 Tax=Phalaenopsis equestris TaxID=78828 RepID=UPI0009E5CD4D|nr:enhancer of mRNA-decapping protein 4-like isoform X2 [Phalaenopsis equestris]
MASHGGNSNQFDMQKLFKPPNPSLNANPNPNSNASFLPPSSYAAGVPHLPYPTVQPPGAFSYATPTPPFHHHPFIHYPQENLYRPGVSYPVQPSIPPNPNPGLNNSGQNPGARLMALLGNSPPAQLEFAASMPPASAPSELPATLYAVPSAPPAVMAVAQAQPARLASTKMPRGRYLGGGERAVHDVDSRLPGETQLPQLEVTPITKYTSDPGLVLGRQIAVNKTYICYGLKLGAIRVLNINTALRSLLRGHSQRVTDMAFFGDEVHLLASASVDGKIFVWKVDEGPDHEDKPQISGKLVLAIQLIGDREYLPRICWHSHKQDILVVGIGNNVLRIDIPKVGRGTEFSADDPLKCPLEQLVDGVQLVGRHDGEVSDLSILQSMTTRLASASNDGTVKIWDDRKSLPLVTLRPHEGQPVHSVSFMTPPQCPDHIVLLTSGPLNRELKLWTSSAEEGWLLPSDSESWRCNQTLELKCSSEHQVEEAFFNQVVVMPQEGLILLANAKKNAIYAVHIDYGPHPAATCMDYIADFNVTMPILSLTGTSDIYPDGEHVVQVYCVQTQAIQQYALNLVQCLPPVDNLLLAKDPCISHVYDGISSTGFSASEISRGTSDIPFAAASPIRSVGVSNSENMVVCPPNLLSSDANNIPELASSNVDIHPSAPPLPSVGSDNLHPTSSPDPLDLDLSQRFTGSKVALKGLEHGKSLGERDVYQEVSDYQAEQGEHDGAVNLPNRPLTNDNFGGDNMKTGPSDTSMIQNSPLMFKLGGTHLVTPLEILSGVKSSSETAANQRIDEVKLLDLIGNNDLKHAEVIKVVDESVLDKSEEFSSQKEANNAYNESKDQPSSSSVSNIMNDKPKEGDAFNAGLYNGIEVQVGDYGSAAGAVEQSSGNIEETVLKNTTDLSQRETGFFDIPASKAAKGKKQKAKQAQVSGSSSPSSSPFNSIDSSNEHRSGMFAPPTEASYSQIMSIQDALNQILSMQKEINKQISTAVGGPIAKEGKRVETALGRSMEKNVKANVDALWARFLEENAKREKAERDNLQHITSLISNFINKDLPAVFERMLKKEIPSIGTSITRSITPILEKTISSTIVDSLQRGLGDKAVNQLEKSVSSKLDTTVTKQIQVQFQTAGKQALQDALRSSLESSLIPAFEQSCKSMFEQVDAAFHKGMSEHNSAALQQFESTHTPLALTLRDAINSASSVTQNLTSELADGQRKLLALASGNAKSLNPMVVQQSNSPMVNLPEMQVEAPLDPTKELSRLISEFKYDEAFTVALQRSDVSIVSWLCSQVDLHRICSMMPLPLNQGVLLALLQQLACDISNDTARKLGWMTDVAAAINPSDPIITLHVRPIFEQVYNILAHQRSLASMTPTEASSIRLIMHVLNSVLMSCK